MSGVVGGRPRKGHVGGRLAYVLRRSNGDSVAYADSFPQSGCECDSPRHLGLNRAIVEEYRRGGDRPQHKKEVRRQELPETGFLRLPQVLSVIPLGKTCWWEGVKTGRFPKPVKLSARCTAWRAEDIRELIKTLSETEYETAEEPTDH